MSDSFQYGDIIFLGLIAVFIALRLRAMLGKNSGIDPREVWKQATREAAADKTPPFLVDRNIKKPVLTEEVLPPEIAANKVLADGLRSIKAADANFSATDFISGAKLAFEWVVSAFTKGDKDKLRMLLSEERFQHFAADIDARAQSGITHETTLVSILATDLTEALLQGTRAHITVQFTTEQMNVTRDKDRNIISGDSSVIEKVVDIWTFERDVSSKDPNWKITAT